MYFFRKTAIALSLCALIWGACLELNAPRRDGIACIEVAQPTLTIDANKPFPKEIKVTVNGQTLINDCADASRKIASEVSVEKQKNRIVFFGKNEAPDLIAMDIRDCRNDMTFFSGKKRPNYTKPRPLTCQKHSDPHRPATVKIQM